MYFPELFTKICCLESLFTSGPQSEAVFSTWVIFGNIWKIDGETVETVSDFIFGGSKSLQMVIAAMKLKDTYSLEGKLWPT